MPLAVTRLELLQVRKLIQCVRQQDLPQIIKLVELGVEGLVDYQGIIAIKTILLPVALTRQCRCALHSQILEVVHLRLVKLFSRVGAIPVFSSFHNSF